MAQANPPPDGEATTQAAGTSAPVPAATPAPTTPPVELGRRPASVDLRSALALLVVAALLGWAGARWAIVGWLALLLVFLGILRALALVLGARQAGADPEEDLAPASPPTKDPERTEPTSGGG